MLSDKLASIADKAAGYALLGRTMEPETAGLVAAALMDAARQVRELEALPFVVIPSHER